MAEDIEMEHEFDEEEAIQWFYVEDDFPLADELAETQIPDPGYAGTNFAIDMESFSFDVFEYWDDMEYGEDEYWDDGGIPEADESTANAGDKRKRTAGTVVRDGNKRRKLSLKDTDGGNVRFVSLAVRNQMAKMQPPILEKRKSFALLPDWKERFAEDSGVVLSKAMPADMQRAAEAKDEDTPPKQRSFDAEAVAADDEEWEDEDEDEKGGEAEEGDANMQDELASLDPEMLKAILKQRLGDAGLEGMDQGAFMQTIAKMLSGEGDADDVAGDLANSLLGQATQTKDNALSGWLSQQGVSLDAATEEDDDASSVATAELPEAAPARNVKNMQVSPPDSAIEMVKGAGTGANTELAIHTGSSPSASAKKRMAPTDEGHAGTKRRKRVTFDVPASSQSAAGPAVEDGMLEPEEKSEPLTSEDPLMSETTVHDAHARAARAKAANGMAVKDNKAKTAGVPGAKLEAKSEADAGAKAPAKDNRKRKAEADGDEVESAAPVSKKQAKKSSHMVPVGTGVEAAGRKTRNTRASARVGR